MADDLIYGSLVTDIGAEKLANIAKNGGKLDITKFQVGDGNGEYYMPTTEQTELKNVVYEGEITGYDISVDDEKLLLIRCEIPSDAGPFFIREWGLVDADNALIAVSNISEISVVPYQTGEIINLRLEIYVQFNNEEIGGVNIVVKPTTEEFLKEDILERVDQLMGKFEAIPDERIDEILGTIVGIKPVPVCNAIPIETVNRILDDDESNDPDYENLEEGAIEGPVLGSIFDVED